MLDYIITRRADLNSVGQSKVPLGTDYETDHRMMRAKRGIIRRGHRLEAHRKKCGMDVGKLDCLPLKGELNNKLKKRKG